MADMDLSKLKVIDLKLELKKRGLSVTGNKNELQDRLQAALLGGGGGLDDTGTDDLLDDDLMDDELDEKELLGHDEHEDELLKESPSPDASEKKHGFKPKHSASSISSSTSDIAAESTTTQVPHKKISLKRNLSVPKPVLPEATVPTTTEDDKKTITSSNGNSEKSDEPDKKIVKLTEMTSEERLKLRAQKFGASASVTTSSDVASDDKKSARAARFGITTSTTSGSSSVSIKNSAPDVSVEVLKKRAERFGASTAPKLNAIELDEKLKKRQERFGAGTTLPSDQAEKARLRLERFKTAA